MKSKRLASFGSALVLSLSSFLVFSAPHVFAAATATWDGGGSDNNFSTAANWVGDVAPLSGDDLVFDNSSILTDQTVNNDLVSATFGLLTFQGTGSNKFTITGSGVTITTTIDAVVNAMIDTDITLGGSVTITGGGLLTIGSSNHNDTLALGSNNLTIAAPSSRAFIDSIITGSGSIVLNSDQTSKLSADNSSYTGAIQINSGSLYAENANALGAPSAGTTVSNGALLLFYMSPASSYTITEPLTLAGAGDGFPFTDYALGTSACGSSGCVESTPFTFSGNITLTADTKVSPGFQMKLSGGLSGAYKMEVAQGQTGKLITENSSNTSQTPNGTYEAPKVTITLSDDQPSIPVSINNNETVVITGKRQSVSVNDGGTLKGTGTVGTVVVNSNARIAPGLSPGCLNTGNLTFVSGSTYDFEVGGPTACTEYDQIKVTGTVDLGNGTLNTILYNGFKPVAGQSYTIVDNDAADAVTGTFNNLAEGATFNISGYVLKITYKGGDGNDVVLSVQSVPTTPNTGFSLIATHPLQTFLAVTCIAGSIALVARRYNKLLVK